VKPIRVMHFRREVPTGGGPESLIVDIARHIDRARFDFSVVTFSPPAPPRGYSTPLLDLLRAADTRVHLLPARHRLDTRPIRQLAGLLDTEGVDILHSHDHRTDLIAYLAARRRPTAQVASLHQPLRRYWWIRHWEMLDEWVVRRFDRILPVAEAVRLEVIGKYPHMADRTLTVLNGVDLSRFSPGEDRMRVRDEFGIPPNGILCANVGRLMEDKGLEYLLDAARQVQGQRQDVYWLLVGRGPAEAELRARSESLGLNRCLQFAGFRTDVPQILAACDVLVVSSLSEGCSVVILEAMACGRPVVATRVGGTPEIVEQDATGLVVEPRRPDLLADAVLDLARAPERRTAMGDRAARRAREHFSIQRMVRRIEEIYTDLASRGAGVIA
jgi:glycosyltransferase involved in cell wall biosynthesis